MTGILLAVFSALLWGTNDYLNKRLLLKGIDENFVLWVRFPIAFILLTPLGLYYWDMSLKLVLYSLVWLPLEVLAGIFFMKGLKYSSLSVGMSFYSLMPVFSALFGWLLLAEKPSLYGFVGMTLIVLACLLLVGFSFREFFRKNRGVLYMLASTALFGFNVVLGKLSVIESNGVFFSWYYSLLMSLAVLVFVKPSELKKKENYMHKEVPLVGLFFAMGDVLYNFALLLTLSSYVASAERLSLLVALIYGRLLLKERTERLLPSALLMLAGNLFLTIS